MGPCLCGDLYCGSCGPAQGNIKCFVCGVWSMDGGCADPDKCADTEEKIMEQMDRDEEEMARYADEMRGNEQL